jgi:hypothetical protein
MARKPSTFMNWLHGHYHAYLDAQKDTGGTASEWVTLVLKEAFDNPDVCGLDAAAKERVAKTSQSIWHSDPDPEQYDLFAVAGFEVEKSYTFRDPTRGEYRRVSSYWATLRHVDGDVVVHTEKVDEAVAKRNRLRTKAAAFRHAVGGDPDARLWNHRAVYAATDADA